MWKVFSSPVTNLHFKFLHRCHSQYTIKFISYSLTWRYFPGTFFVGIMHWSLVFLMAPWEPSVGNWVWRGPDESSHIPLPRLSYWCVHRARQWWWDPVWSELPTMNPVCCTSNKMYQYKIILWINIRRNPLQDSYTERHVDQWKS